MKRYIRKAKNNTGKTVKVCAIKASAQSGFKDYKKSMMGLPQNIFSLAAATPDWVQLQMVDETVDIQVDYSTDAEIIVIMFHTPDAVRGYAIAEQFRKLGKVVVLGGLHVTFMQDEALQHADSILIGECEGIWEELLIDYKAGKLKKSYERTSPVDLRDLKPYPTDIIPASVYDYSWTIMVSRGCVNKCSYCTVNKFFPSYRKRPIVDIVDEIKNCGTDFIELKADNMTVDREYALKLFKAIEPLNIIWFTALEPSFADDKELVEAAARSGLRSILLGVETPSRKSLSEQKKGHLELEKLKERIDYLHSFDIEIDSAMLFGFDDHDENIWQETLEFALEIGIDVTHGVVPIPFPGTDLYKKLDAEGRLTTKDWSKYEGSYLVYKHPVFSEMDIYHGILWYEREFNKRKTKRDFKWHHRWDNYSNASYGYDGKKYSQGNAPRSRFDTEKWKAVLGIAVVLIGIMFNLSILFGILYILWAVDNIRYGQAYILSNVTRDRNPILFWITTMIWLLSGIYVFVDALINNWLVYIF